MNVVQMLQDDKIAKNPWQAAHIATGLRLWELTEEAQIRERYIRYRSWRNAGEPPSVAYLNAIEGREPMALIEADTQGDNDVQASDQA